MSHKTTIETKIKIKSDLIATLKDMKYNVIENCQVQGYGSQTYDADIGIQINGKIMIGFKQNKGFYEAVGDSYVQRDMHERVKAINEQYLKRVTIRELARKGYRFVKEEATEKGGIKLVLQRR